MKTRWLKQIETYDGTQLRSLYAYLQHKILGDSVIAWRGPCNIPFSHMVDGEDLLEQSVIAGSDMLHFVIEIFDQKLITGVLLQRFFASIVKDELEQKTSVSKLKLQRSGDDIYWGKKKLSISIATSSPVSTLVHFAINISSKGTPVPTAGLDDLKLKTKPQDFAEQCMKILKLEYETSIEATCKVRPVP